MLQLGHLLVQTLSSLLRALPCGFIQPMSGLLRVLREALQQQERGGSHGLRAEKGCSGDGTEGGSSGAAGTAPRDVPLLRGPPDAMPWERLWPKALPGPAEQRLPDTCVCAAMGSVQHGLLSAGTFAASPGSAGPASLLLLFAAAPMGTWLGMSQVPQCSQARPALPSISASAG